MRSLKSPIKFTFTALGAFSFLSALGACVGQVDGNAGGTSSGNSGTAGVSSTPAPGNAGATSTGSGGSSSGSGSGGMSTNPTGTGSTKAVSAPYTRLTRAEYQATVKAAFGVDASISGIPADGQVGPYTSNAEVLPDPAGAFMLAGEDLAALIVPGKIAACTAATASTCIPQKFQPAIEKLYRRSLTAAEVASFANMLSTLEKAGVSSQDATREMLSYAFMSPDFLFRASPAAGDAARGRQLSEQLSYALWDAPPDSALTMAAQGSTTDLGTRLRSQAARLAKDPRAVTPIARFIGQWLGVDIDNNLSDSTYASSPLYLELLAFVQDALTNNVPVTSFVNGTHGFVQKTNFTAYGMSAVSSTANVVPVTWPATSARRGIIGEELVMDNTRNPDPTRRPIFRGKLVQVALLCNQIPPPPPELQALQGEVTDRTADPRCMGCHKMMEPVGAAFASVDLDHTGTTPPAVLTGSPEVAGTYADLPTLLDKIAKSQTYADCFSRNLLGFFLEQDPTQVNADAVADLSSLVKAGGGFADVVAQTIVTLEARSKPAIAWCAAQ